MTAADAEIDTRPRLGAVWNALAGVVDPEIPAVSVVDLGIVRGVRWDDDAGDRNAADRDVSTVLTVIVTPTYAGCPATDRIAEAIRDALEAIGISRVDLRTRLAPAWTTDWISAEGARRLRDYGIAPPQRCASAAPRAGASMPIDVAGISPLRNARVAIACPRCGSAETQLVSQFGSTACKALYRCVSCLEPFDYFKPH